VLHETSARGSRRVAQATTWAESEDKPWMSLGDVSFGRMRWVGGRRTGAESIDVGPTRMYGWVKLDVLANFVLTLRTGPLMCGNYLGTRLGTGTKLLTNRLDLLVSFSFGPSPHRRLWALKQGSWTLFRFGPGN
jgi:hypothetical protein